jgi:hypothetical protein
VFERGRDLFRSLVARQRETGRELAARERELRDLALATVEALEMLADTVESYAADLPAESAAAIAAVRAAAFERVEQAGLRFDGAAGEPVDLSRHRVVKSRRAAVPAPTVRAVVRRGVTMGAARVREAEVVIDEPEAP